MLNNVRAASLMATGLIWGSVLVFGLSAESVLPGEPAPIGSADTAAAATPGAAQGIAPQANVPGTGLPLPNQPASAKLSGSTDLPANPLPMPGEGASVFILDYHTFLDSHKSSIDYSLDEFASQLDAMTALGCHFVSMDDAIAGRIHGRLNIVLTIDDGNHSIYAACKKVIEPRGIKTVLFVYPAIILGHQFFAITREQLVELSTEGFEIGAHGYHHNPLSVKALAKDPKDFRTEIRKPAGAIAEIIGARPTLFAYPFGVYSPEAEAGLKLEGYAWAFAADDKMVAVNFSDPGLDHMAVPRTIVYRWNFPIIMRTLKRLAADLPK